MANDFTLYLWLLKLGALVNLYFLANTLGLSAHSADPHVIIPARVLFAVSAFRCLFPVRYKDNVVFHDTALSSIFLTRLLATFSEVTFIYLLSHVIRTLNVDHVGWVNALSWLMVLQVVLSQVFVWGAIATRRLVLYYYEELGWGIIIAANTIASAQLYFGGGSLGASEILITLNLLFGMVYLPWQLIHLRALHADASRSADADEPIQSLTTGLQESIRARNQATDAEAWGGIVGLTWMVGYWATLIPMWVNQIVVASP